MEKYRKPSQLGYKTPLQTKISLEHRAGELMVGKLSSPYVVSNASPQPHLVGWLRSGRNLDLCLLAVCSCVLTVLCHQTAVLMPSSPTLTGTSAASTAPIANLSRIDLTIKAGLFTQSSGSDPSEDS